MSESWRSRCSSSLSLKAQKPGGALDVSLSLRAGEDQCPRSTLREGEKKFFHPHVVLFRPPGDSVRPTYFREGSVLYSVY